MNDPATHDSSRREFLSTVAVGSVAVSVAGSVAASLPLGPRASADVTPSTTASAATSVRANVPRYHAAAIQTAFENPKTRAEIPARVARMIAMAEQTVLRCAAHRVS